MEEYEVSRPITGTFAEVVNAVCPVELSAAALSLPKRERKVRAET